MVWLFNPFTKKLDRISDVSEYLRLDGTNGPMQGNLSMGSYDLVDINALQLDTNPITSHSEGQLHWNDIDKTLDIDTEIADVVIQAGQDLVIKIINNSGSLITGGSVVYINNATGQRPTIALADADFANTSHSTLGVTMHDISNNSEGYINIFGLVRDLNTSSFIEGDILYLSTTPGQLTKIAPTKPDHIVRVGYCVYSHATNGIILIDTSLGADLVSLHDVDISAVADNQVLQYEAASQLWKNKTLAVSGGASKTNFSNPLESITNLWSTTIIGSATATYANRVLTLQTGATGGSGVWISPNMPQLHTTAKLFDKDPEIALLCQMSVIAAGANGSAAGFILNDGLPAATGILTSKHFGFISRSIDGVNVQYFASSADGVTQQLTNITASVQSVRKQFYYAKMTSGGDIKFYIDGNLVATHSTNIPSGSTNVSTYLYLFVRNGAGITVNSKIEMRDFNMSLDLTKP